MGSGEKESVSSYGEQVTEGLEPHARQMSKAAVAVRHPQQQPSRRRSKTAGASATPLLVAFKTVYTVLRRQHRALEAYLDSAAVPEEQRQSRLGEFQRLTSCLNVLIAEIGRIGHRMSRREILDGFGESGK